MREILWEWVSNAKNHAFWRLRLCENELKTQESRFLTREILWGWAHNSKFLFFSCVRSCENEIQMRKTTLFHAWDCVRMNWKREKIAFSHAWDFVRMSSKLENFIFLTREIMWEWVLCRNIPIFSQCNPPPVIPSILGIIFFSRFWELGNSTIDAI